LTENSYQYVPIYESERSAKNMWQDYRVFPDRVELRCWILLRTIVIPAADIVDVEVRSRAVFNLKHWYALKIDWAGIFSHVEIRRKSGLFKHIIFTPDNPAYFVAACKSIMKSPCASI
jgi:hypothetical protein